MPSISGHSFSTKSMMYPNCSAVPVARKSTGFAAEEPENSFVSNCFCLVSGSAGMPIPPLERMSVSITAGPPAWVTMHMLRPRGTPLSRIQATVSSWFLPLQRIMPAFSNRAVTAASGLARAPVWDEAARLPSSEEPALMAAIRAPFLYKEAACLYSLSGFCILST